LPIERLDDLVDGRALGGLEHFDQLGLFAVGARATSFRFALPGLAGPGGLGVGARRSLGLALGGGLVDAERLEGGGRYAQGQASALLVLAPDVGERTVCLAQADDWLNTHETDESAFKTRSWLRQPPTEKQLQYLPPECRHNFGLTRYRASALMTFGFNKRAILQLIDAAAAPERRAA
jgi:hypothetical protein